MLDHSHYAEWAEDGLAFFVDYLPIRGVLNRTTNIFEGKVAAHFIRQEYPLKDWPDKLRTLCVDDYVACEDIFLTTWPHPYTRLRFANVCSNLAAYWEQKTDYLEYPFRTSNLNDK